MVAVKSITFSGPGPRRLPVGLSVARAEDDPRPAHVVEPGETVEVDDELFDRMVEEPFWSAPAGSKPKRGSGSKPTSGDTMAGTEDGPVEEEIS